MKATVVLFLLIASIGTVCGQGLISFQNIGFSQFIHVNDTAVGGGRVTMETTPQKYTFYVVYGTDSSALNNTSISTPVYNSTSTSGLLAGNTSFVLNNAPGNSPIFLKMYGFETSFGSFDNARNTVFGHTGESVIIQVTPASSPTPGTVIFGNTADATHIAPFDLYFNFGTVPEPSTIALGVIGMTGLIFVRRRK